MTGLARGRWPQTTPCDARQEDRDRFKAPGRPLTHPRAALALALIVALGGCSASIGGRGAGASVGTPIGTVGVGTDGSLEGSRVGVRIGRWWDF